MSVDDLRDGEAADDDGEDLLGLIELAVRAAAVHLAEAREALRLQLDRHDALVALRDRALEIATRGDGQAVVDLFGDCDEDERARIQSLVERGTSLDLPDPTIGAH